MKMMIKSKFKPLYHCEKNTLSRLGGGARRPWSPSGYAPGCQLHMRDEFFT